MNKAQLVEKVALKTGFPKKEIENIIDAVLRVITNTIRDGEEATLTGFGNFSAKIRHARAGVNPQNPKEKIRIPEVRVPKFKAGKALKDALKQRQE